MTHDVAYLQSDPTYPATRQLIFDYFGRDIPADVTVAANDDMYAYSCHYCGGRSIGTMAYFRAGLDLFDCVNYIATWKFGGLDRAGSILDFASGHGRLTRFLAASYPKQQIWTSDIVPDAVRFQSEQLGVNSVQSTTVPEDFHLDRKFDLIYVGSLFTHLPDKTFRRWLRRLFELLTPNGILALSTHGLEHLKPDASMPATGIFFIPETEVPSLDVEDYGATIVTDDYVKGAIRNVAPNAYFRTQRRAVGFNQDLWVLSPSPLPQMPLAFDQGPQGYVDHTQWRTPKELWLSGWAACIHEGHQIDRVEVLLNGNPIGQLRIDCDRPDVAQHLHDPRQLRSGWSGLVQSPSEIRPWQDVISVLGVCTGGKRASLRTMHACAMMQFAADAVPPQVSEPHTISALDSSTRAKLHRALDYAMKGDLGTLVRNAGKFVIGR